MLLPLLIACAPTGSDTASPQAGPVRLDDHHQLPFTTRLEVSAQTMRSGEDASVDWSRLQEGDRGEAMIAGDVTAVRLRQFADFTPAALTEGLSAQTITQADVSVTLRCQPVDETSRCSLSDFTFEAGHYFDTPAALTEGSGTWLAEVFVDSAQPAAARILLLADDDAPLADALLTDDSSAVVVTASAPSEPLPVGGTLDWSDLTETGDGSALLADRVESAVLVAAADVSALEALILDPAGMPAITSAEVYGETTLTLDEALPSGAPLWLILQGRGSEQHLTLSLFSLDPS